MKLLYYNEIKNFGDDLNSWLWPKVFNLKEFEDSIYFTGIGTILFRDNPILYKAEKKIIIVFGSGVRYFQAPIFNDDHYDIRFVRGPLSKFALSDSVKYISDGAYCLRFIKSFNKYSGYEKKYNVSIIPYFKSVELVNWEKISNQLGFHLIDPKNYESVDQVLKEIAQSKYIITEAMHGAILADVLRVPWQRFIFSTPNTETPQVSEFKWLDWLQTIGQTVIKPIVINPYGLNRVSRHISSLTANSVQIKFKIRQISEKKIINKLCLVKDYYLSKDYILNEINEKLHTEIELLKKDYQ